MEVMRIKAVDMDLVNTDNWLAAFEIVSGNEGGYLSITTDAATNEGVITVVKVKRVALFIGVKSVSEMKTIICIPL